MMTRGHHDRIKNMEAVCAGGAVSLNLTMSKSTCFGSAFFTASFSIGLTESPNAASNTVTSEPIPWVSRAALSINLIVGYTSTWVWRTD